MCQALLVNYKFIYLLFQKIKFSWCDWPESNRHGKSRQILSLLRLPITPQSQSLGNLFTIDRIVQLFRLFVNLVLFFNNMIKVRYVQVLYYNSFSISVNRAIVAARSPLCKMPCPPTAVHSSMFTVRSSIKMSLGLQCFCLSWLYGPK